MKDSYFSVSTDKCPEFAKSKLPGTCLQQTTYNKQL